MYKFKLTAFFRHVLFSGCICNFLVFSNAIAQLQFVENNPARYSEQVFSFLASEIALQRGDAGSAFQTLIALAKDTKDPRIAQRAMEIALIAKSPAAALEASKLWSEYSPTTDTTSKEVMITLLMLNDEWDSVIAPAISLLSTKLPVQRDQFLQQWRTLISRSKQEDSAIRAFSKIISGTKPLTKNKDLLFIYSMGEEKEGRIDSMEAILKSIIRLDPNNKNALNALGYSYADRNIKLTEALKMIQKAHQMAPDDPYILDSLAWVNYRLGNLALAKTLLQESYEKLPEVEVGAHLGEVLWILGDAKGAETIWRKVEAIDANHKTLKDTLRRLRPDWAAPEVFDSNSKRHWDGRFAVKVNGSSGQNGGSGSFSLDHDEKSDNLEIRSSLGASIAKVVIGPAKATLEQNGKIYEAVDADSLIEQAISLPIPARGLPAWLSGFIRPGSQGVIQRNDSGQVIKIEQDGWVLVYDWAKKDQLQKLTLTRQTSLNNIDIKLIFDIPND